MSYIYVDFEENKRLIERLNTVRELLEQIPAVYSCGDGLQELKQKLRLLSADLAEATAESQQTEETHFQNVGLSDDEIRKRLDF